MAWRHDTMMNPPIEELFARADSKFRLVTLASKREPTEEEPAAAAEAADAAAETETETESPA